MSLKMWSVYGGDEMKILLIYIVLFALTFIFAGLSLMISERCLKDILIISALNILFFLSAIIYKAIDRLAKRKLRRVFKIEPDEENGNYHYKRNCWIAYGGDFEEASFWNTFKNNLRVLFGRGKIKEVTEVD